MHTRKGVYLLEGASLYTRVHARAGFLVVKGGAKCGISLNHLHQSLELRPFAWKR